MKEAAWLEWSEWGLGGWAGTPKGSKGERRLVQTLAKFRALDFTE